MQKRALLRRLPSLKPVRLLLLFFVFFSQEVFPASPPVASYPHAAVAADSEIASKIGAKILADGGDAIDAAVATALALGVVHPHSSGIGGGGFLLMYRADEKKVYALDFREMAPKGASTSLYQRDGKAATDLSQKGALAVAIPGEISGLTEAHKKWGKRPWKDLTTPASKLAKEGFPIDGPLSAAIRQIWPKIDSFPGLKKMLAGDDPSKMPLEGETWKRPDLAKTLDALGKDPSSFYSGALAKEIAKVVSEGGGILTEEDLKSYAPVWREPMRGEYRGYEVVAMGPPSSGGAVVIEVLNLLEGYDLRSLGLNSSAYLHLLAEAEKHAFSDRAHYFGDPSFVDVPTPKLTSQEYADHLASKITERTHPKEYYGLAAEEGEEASSGALLQDSGTTHFSIIDAAGNAVALTTTVNLYFGSQVVVGGFPLNDEMDDFSLSPGVANGFGLVGSEANAIAPGKRPLSSMSPTILLKDGLPVLVVGGSGGPRIISGVIQVILNVVDFGSDVSRAVDISRAHHQWLPDVLLLEPDIPRDVVEGLMSRGHEIKELPPGSVDAVGIVQAVARDPSTGKVTAASDPRKGGIPAGY